MSGAAKGILFIPYNDGLKINEVRTVLTNNYKEVYVISNNKGDKITGNDKIKSLVCGEYDDDLRTTKLTNVDPSDVHILCENEEQKDHFLKNREGSIVDIIDQKDYTKEGIDAKIKQLKASVESKKQENEKQAKEAEEREKQEEAEKKAKKEAEKRAKEEAEKQAKLSEVQKLIDNKNKIIILPFKLVLDNNNNNLFDEFKKYNEEIHIIGNTAIFQKLDANGNIKGKYKPIDCGSSKPITTTLSVFNKNDIQIIHNDLDVLDELAKAGFIYIYLQDAILNESNILTFNMNKLKQKENNDDLFKNNKYVFQIRGKKEDESLYIFKPDKTFHFILEKDNDVYVEDGSENIIDYKQKYNEYTLKNNIVEFIKINNGNVNIKNIDNITNQQPEPKPITQTNQQPEPQKPEPKVLTAEEKKIEEIKTIIKGFYDSIPELKK
jgi:hypothetical protein